MSVIAHIGSGLLVALTVRALIRSTEDIGYLAECVLLLTLTLAWFLFLIPR